jgi:GT2 family glycosyltransferase/glycosyltransferase involved in cell wall biosynthesis
VTGRGFGSAAELGHGLKSLALPSLEGELKERASGAPKMSNIPKHQQGLELFERGQFEDAVRLLGEALAERESSELWSDWATAQAQCRHPRQAEQGYRRALELNPTNGSASASLGVLLAAAGRDAEAIPWLERAINELPVSDRPQVAAALESCRQRQAKTASLEPGAPAGNASLNVLVVHETLPQPDRSGSDVRVVQVLEELRAQGHRLTYVARSGVGREQYAPPLEKLGIRIWAHDVERLRYLNVDTLVDWSFDQVVCEGKFDLAILFLWFWNGTSVPEHYLEEIRRFSAGTRIVVISEDQHGLRETRMAGLSNCWTDFERGHDFTGREIEVYRRADMVRVISEDDRRGLLQRAPELNIDVMPMVAGVAPEGPGFAQRTDFLFVGNFDNLASRDGAAWLLAEVWPRVRKRLPEARIALVGNNLPAQLGAGQEGVRQVGHVPDLEPLFAQYRVFAGPVRYGTGIKTKNLGALAHGLPLVTTTIGAEGMNLSDGVHALIADTPEALADAMVRAYSDEELWDTLSRNGRKHIGEEFGRQRLQAAIRSLVQQAREIQPKPYEAGYRWSYLLVEERYPQVLYHRPPYHRRLLRLVGHVSLAEELTAQHRPAEALEQLQHIFSTIRGEVVVNALFLRALALMTRCYRELGDTEKAKSYAGIAEKFAYANDLTRKRKGGSEDRSTDLSVIIPTFNRKETLRACLANLALQALPTRRWEVIVVDDGSTDGTAELCRTFPEFYRLRYIRQENAGAGAARRLGVEQASGEYVLFINDDTMAHSLLLGEHLRAQREHRREKISVLGNFRYPGEASERALTHYLSTSPFLFPQATLKPGMHTDPAYFITCNLSVRRDAVLAAGSFDPQFTVGEDTDLGIRLRAAGYRVLYNRKALAVHDHLDMTIGDLVRRAHVYGRNRLLFYRKYPHLLGDGSGLFGRLDEAAVRNIVSYLEQHREEVEKALEAVTRYDTVDFLPFFAEKISGRAAAEEILNAFQRAIPAIYQYHLYEGFLEAWRTESQLASVPAVQGKESAKEVNLQPVAQV